LYLSKKRVKWYAEYMEFNDGFDIECDQVPIKKSLELLKKNLQNINFLSPINMKEVILQICTWASRYEFVQ